MASILDALLSRIQQGTAEAGQNILPGVAGGVQGGIVPQPPPQIPQQVSSQLLPKEKTPKSGTGQEQSQSNTLQTLLKLGIPLGAAIAGSVNPNILPQAAGLTKGFTEETIRQEEAKGRERKIKVFDEETGEIIDTGQVANEFDKILTKSKDKEDFRDKLLSELLGIEKPEAKTGEGIKVAEEKIKEFNSLDEANNAGLPKGSKFKVGDRTGTIK